MKLWDLSTQHCVQTIVAHRSDIWAMGVDPARSMIFTGSGEGELKAWSLDHDALKEGLKETETGEVHFCTKVSAHILIYLLYRLQK